MVKAQVSLEFLFSILIFIYIVIVIVTSVFRAYNFVSADSLQTRANLISRGIAGTIMESPGTSGWETDPYEVDVKQIGMQDQGTISYSKLAALKGLSYGELKKLFNIPYDFRLTIRYLPSIVLDIRPENPILSLPDQTVVGPNTFDSGDLSKFIVTAKNSAGETIAPKLYGIVEKSANGFEIVEGTEFSNAYRASFNITTPGTYTLTFLALKTDTHQFGKTDFVITVI